MLRGRRTSLVSLRRELGGLAFDYGTPDIFSTDLRVAVHLRSVHGRAQGPRDSH